MRTATECTERAEECRKLAELASKPKDWAHFSEMAETWEQMAKRRKQKEANQLADTFALAEAIANGREQNAA
jgi:hypothetical protein